MSKSLWIIIIVSALLFAFCGKEKKTAEAAPPGGKAGKETVKTKAADATMTEDNPAAENYIADHAPFAIKECVYDPENPTVNDDVTITPFIDEGFSADELILKDVTYTFRWIVQNQEIADAQGNKLEKKYFKKMDWIQCWVRGFFKDQETPEYRARVIRIQNSTPLLNLKTTKGVVVPGEFIYQITASDPDNDKLTYSLIAPLDLGIKLNAETGLLTWLVDEALAQNTKATEIKFSVSDPDGGKVESSITLSFSARETAKPQNY